jgi:deazaflavin-dependent oxidoreductase (nitroreductase family)
MPTYKNAHVRDSVRSFNKHVINPAMAPLAGRRHWYAAQIRHTGRKSGKHYSTPVVAVKVSDGVVVPLPYGSGVDWLRNVLAAGDATITSNGRTYHVIQPKVIDADTAEPQLSAWRRWTYHASNVDSYVKFSVAE